jgi:hypothetical protein
MVKTKVFERDREGREKRPNIRMVLNERFVSFLASIQTVEAKEFTKIPMKPICKHPIALPFILLRWQQINGGRSQKYKISGGF